MPIHDTGAWLDDETGEVVYEPPRRGTQLVSKGGEVSTAVKTRIAALGLEVNGVNVGTDEEPDEVPAEEPADDDGGDADKTVTTSGTRRTRKSTK